MKKMESILFQLSGEKVTVDDANKISIKDTYNDFEKTVFDGLQLAFKITANSLVWSDWGTYKSCLFERYCCLNNCNW